MVPHYQVHNVLNRGHIFINTSIAEAFCIAVLEAVACGLKVVSTNVGGIPEILPHDMVLLAEPNSKDLLSKLEQAMQTYNNFSASDFNKRIGQYYSWRDVAERTENIYYKTIKLPKVPLSDHFRNVFANWCYLLVIFCSCTILQCVMWFMDLIDPRDKVETAINFSRSRYNSNPDIYGDHGMEVTDPKLLGNERK